ncbi:MULTISPECIES: helix-turn-helix domain-containing protein [Thermocrispum]|jgi:transcriptional regulator GlxA family with amidase domain|uniref:AraC family transcriptional regulator n=1 Tax=Thermocrispum agreste TaxID=37925 RepID=A0A2W4J1M4_9PSEU|nr:MULTISPECIES: helix-turn-helix domain-containing protein [Thermocrispum]PZM92078.1 MAG: AraC family transcriptional regulator [Thermocrispum agreste]
MFRDLHRVVVLALDPVVGFDLAIPPMVFSCATDADGSPLYDIRVCGLGTAPMPTPSNYAIVPGSGPEALRDADTVIIPGTKMPGPFRHGVLPDDVARALDMIPSHARVMSICTGAFVLGAAGILDGRPATTHWHHADEFRQLYPRVKLDETVLFVDDGDVLTSAGLSAGIDLCLHVVRSDHGSEVANRAARYCVVPPWREGGQSQFIERHVPDDDTASTAPTRAWALQHLAERLDLATLAAHAHMSVRTFSRKFRAETGMSPGAWLTQQRIDHARHLLETTDLSIDEVARVCGLGTAASLRQHLRSSIGVSPLAYRRTFRAPDERAG